MSGPELISNTYLSLFLTQLQHEGYSIFIIGGILPDCVADQVLANQRVTQVKKPSSMSRGKKGKTEAVRLVEEATVGLDGFTDEEREQLKSLIESSKQSREEDERRQLEAAMSASLCPDDRTVAASPAIDPNEMTEEEMLEAAVKMSLES